MPHMIGELEEMVERIDLGNELTHAGKEFILTPGSLQLSCEWVNNQVRVQFSFPGDGIDAQLLQYDPGQRIQGTDETGPGQCTFQITERVDGTHVKCHRIAVLWGTSE